MCGRQGEAALASARGVGLADQIGIVVVAEAAELASLAAAVESFGYAVRAAESSGAAALAAIGEAPPDLALIDLAVEGAFDAARSLSVAKGISVVWLGHAPAAERLREAQSADPLGYVLKPFDDAQLRITLHAALATRRRLSKPQSASRFPPGRLLQTIFQSVNEGVGVVDTKGEIRYANPAASRMTQMSVDHFDRRLANFKLLGPDKATPLPWDEVPPLRALRMGESATNVEAYMVPPTANEGIFVSVDAKPLYDDEGRRSGALVVFRDIGEQKATEAELRQTAARLAEQTHTMEAVFDGIADGVVVVDAAGAALRFNRAALAILAPDSGERTDQPTSIPGIGMYYPDRITPIPEDDLPHNRVLRGEPCDGMRIFVTHPNMPDGALLSVSARSVQVAEDASARVVVSFRDVTADEQQERALLNAFAQGRVEVTDTILHNVGNAINSVTTGVGTLRERLRSRKLLLRLSAVVEALADHDDDWMEYLSEDPIGVQTLPFMHALNKDWQKENAELQRTVERVADRVHHIVEILRGQQRLDRGAAERKTVRLSESVWAGVRILEESLNRRGIAIEVDCTRAPTETALQESRFQQMLVNLVGNCIDAIDARAAVGGSGFRGAVRIAGYVADEQFFLDVTDNGIGIDAAHLEKVFTPGFTTKKGGTGLGLHSAANYVMGSGGSIRALSEGPNTGTTIRSSWPVGAGQAAERTQRRAVRQPSSISR